MECFLEYCYYENILGFIVQIDVSAGSVRDQKTSGKCGILLIFV